MQNTSDEPLPMVLDPVAIAKSMQTIPAAPIRPSPPPPPMMPPPPTVPMAPLTPLTPLPEATPTLPAPPDDTPPDTEIEPEPRTEPETKTTAPTSPRPSSGAARWSLRLALLVVVVGGELALAHRNGLLDLPGDLVDARAMLTTAMHGRAFDAARTAPAANVAAAPIAAPPSDPNASTTDAIDIPPDMGLVTTMDAKPGHRIFVDDRTVGETPNAVLVKCGTATVKLGSAGRARAVEIPCGESVNVDD